MNKKLPQALLFKALRELLFFELNGRITLFHVFTHMKA